MNWKKGIMDAENLLSILNSKLTSEKKIRNVFTETDSITSDDATALRRDDIHKWRENFLESGLPDLKENELADQKLSKVQNELLKKMEDICNDIIEENNSAIEKDK